MPVIQLDGSPPTALCAWPAVVLAREAVRYNG
jgi:hypothetical protein